MEIGIVGLGRMGGDMARRWMRGGHTVVGTTRDSARVRELAREGMKGALSLEELAAALPGPRVVWVMLPSGDTTHGTVLKLADILEQGDTIVDGGNSNYNDTIRLARQVSDRGIDFADVGVSGGIWGLREGYCLMAGGSPDVVGRIRPALETLAPAPDRGFAHVGPTGAGHFVKMVHNGIEYGMMQALAEGFELLHRKEAFDLDLAGIAEIWRHSSVVRSWLLDLSAAALAENPKLDGIGGFVSDSGEGRWTVKEAIDLGVPVPAISAAVFNRFSSQKEDGFAERLLAAMRLAFGGHAVREKR